MTPLRGNVQPPLDHDAESLLATLADIGRSNTPLEGIDPKSPKVQDLLALLQPGPGPMPSASNLRARDGWLDDVERAHLALKAVERNAAFAELRTGLERYLDAAIPALETTTNAWLHGSRAQAADASLLPWSKLLARIASQPLPDEPSSDLLDAWMDGLLTDTHASELQQRARTQELFQGSYRKLVAVEASVLDVCTYDPRWSLDVARDTTELDDDNLLFWLPLPHVERGATLRIHHHARGTCWSLPWGKPVLVPFERREHTWGDEVLGEITTRIEVEAPTPHADLIHGVETLGAALRKECRDPRVLEASRAIAGTFVRGPTAGWLDAARDAFDAGRDPDANTIDHVACAFSARLTLEDAAAALFDPDLYTDLVAADEACADRASAVLLLPDAVYEDIVGDAELDEETWWGARARLRDRVPPLVLDAAFAELRAHRDARAAATTPAAYDSVRPSYELAAAEAPTGYDQRAGTIHVLAVRADREALPIEVRLSRRPGRGLFPDDRVRLTARSAVVDAFHAAASLTPNGPPFSLEEHALDLVEPDAFRLESLDGDSLGLPLALAFLSLWLDRPLPADLFATGSLSLHAEHGWTVRSVGFVREKALGLTRTIRHAARLLIPADDEASAGTTDGLSILPVARLAEAVATAALDATRVTGAPSVTARFSELNRLAEHVERQDLTAHVQAAELAGLTPWHFVATRMKLLIDTLPAEKPPTVEHRAWAALAFTHAGRFDEGARLLPSEPAKNPATRTLQLVVEVGTLIDREDWPECNRAASQLEATLTELPADARDIRGKALGTLGRAAMHQHDVARAIPLLERAVDDHHEHLPAEAPRSRVYLAMALRTAGRYAEATKQLDTARRELDEHTLRWFDRPAYRISLAYWSYERARLHVAMDQPDSALEHVETALDLLRPHDDWPRIGILRTAAWAHRLRGEHERADALAAAIRSHRDRFPWRELLDALAVEASGMPGGRNVVY